MRPKRFLNKHKQKCKRSLQAKRISLTVGRKVLWWCRREIRLWRPCRRDCMIRGRRMPYWSTNYQDYVLRSGRRRNLLRSLEHRAIWLVRSRLTWNSGRLSWQTCETKCQLNCSAWKIRWQRPSSALRQPPLKRRACKMQWNSSKQISWNSIPKPRDYYRSSLNRRANIQQSRRQHPTSSNKLIESSLIHKRRKYNFRIY